MQKMKLWMLAATLICGASVFTSCSDDDDNVNMPTFLQPGDKWDAETGTLYVNSNPGKNAYREQTDIVSVVFSDAVTSIGDSAFYNCHINAVDLPASVVNIGSRAFAGKKSDLDIVTILATDCTFGEHSFFQSILTNIYVPAESLADYKANHPDYANHFYAIPEVQQEGKEIIWDEDLCGYIWLIVPYYHQGKIVAAHNTQGGITVTLTATEVENGFNWTGISLAQGEKLTFTSSVGKISQITIQIVSYNDEEGEEEDEEDEKEDVPVAEGWSWDAANKTFTWQGTPSATVEMLASGKLNLEDIQIKFTIE